MTTAVRASRTTAAARNRATLHRPDLRTEKDLMRQGCERLAAIDEVGRGALAGPVTVGAVVVTSNIGRVPAGLRDSKLLTPAARQALVPHIRRWVVEYAVGHAWPEEIDRIGIIAALRLAGRRALANLSGPVDAVLLDGNHNYLAEPEPGLFDDEAVVVRRPPPLSLQLGDVPATVHLKIKADLKCAAVAGASVLAKTERDGLLMEMDTPFPRYRFAVNKGYATADHVTALREHGPSAVHRQSWRLPLTWQAGDPLLGEADIDADEQS
jgi:ribonuclease HII